MSDTRRLILRLCGWCLACMPAAFRRDFGAEMLAVTALRLGEPGRSPLGWWRMAAGELAGYLGCAGAEWMILGWRLARGRALAGWRGAAMVTTSGLRLATAPGGSPALRWVGLIGGCLWSALLLGGMLSMGDSWSQWLLGLLAGTVWSMPMLLSGWAEYSRWWQRLLGWLVLGGSILLLIYGIGSGQTMLGLGFVVIAALPLGLYVDLRSGRKWRRAAGTAGAIAVLMFGWLQAEAAVLARRGPNPEAGGTRYYQRHWPFETSAVVVEADGTIHWQD